MHRPRVLLAALAVAAIVGCASTSGLALEVAGGGTCAPLDDTRHDVVVLVFTSPDCPIANAMAPALERVYAYARAQDVAFHLVHARDDVTSARAAAHARDFGLTMPVLLDHEHQLVRRTGATVTPEAVVLRRVRDGWSRVYQGPVNNLYASLGNRRDQATEHWLYDAVTAAAAGETVMPAVRTPLGCTIEPPRGTGR